MVMKMDMMILIMKITLILIVKKNHLNQNSKSLLFNSSLTAGNFPSLFV